MPKPILKWVGGKTQIMDSIMVQVPKVILGDYHEPFVGGGSVLFKILETIEIIGTVYASDVNPHLIEFYKMVQSDPEQLIQDTKSLALETSEIEYYKVRADFLENPTPARFLYLNKTCFRGLYREGPRGFNVPWGHYNKPNIVDDSLIRQISNLIKNVVFRVLPFQESLRGPFTNQDFVYLDPPYVNTFSGYTRRGFSSEDHACLFKTIKEVIPRFLLSNSDCEQVRESFEGFTQISLECRRAIHSINPGTVARELLIFT